MPTRTLAGGLKEKSRVGCGGTPVSDADADAGAAREEAYFGAAWFDDDELRDAAEEDGERRAVERGRLPSSTWAFMSPILSARLVELNKDAVVRDGGVDSSVDLDAHRADSDLDELDFGDEHPAAR